MVLFINNGWYFPGLSGGDVHVMEVANRWGQDRQVGIAMPEWAYRLHADRLANVRLIPTSGRLDRVPPRSLVSLSARYVLRCIRSLGLHGDIVVAGSHYPYDLVPAVVISRFGRRPLVVYVFHLSSKFRRHGARARLVALWEWAALRLLRLASLVFVDNTDVGADLVAAKISNSRIQVTWNAGTSLDQLPMEARRGDEVVFCGRIVDTKGWQDLLIVAERLKESCPGVILRVLGDGERRKDLEEGASTRQLGTVIRIEGFVSEDVKWRALRRATVFVTPSREEGWGIAVSEALQAGAEVVCYDLPVYHEVHAQEHLHFVPLGDVEAFANRVVTVVSRGLSTARNAKPQSISRSEQSSIKTWAEIASRELAVVSSTLEVGPQASGDAIG